MLQDFGAGLKVVEFGHGSMVSRQLITDKDAIMPRPATTVAKAAEIMAVSEDFICACLNNGELEGFHAGRVKRVFLDSIDDYQARHAIAADEAPKPPRRSHKPPVSESYLQAEADLRKLGIE